MLWVFFFSHLLLFLNIWSISFHSFLVFHLLSFMFGSFSHLTGMCFQSFCYNPGFGLATTTRACKGAGQEWVWESHFMLLGVQKNVREWSFTLPNEFPFWELESPWTPKVSKGNCRGQNLLNWNFFYIIGKLLECKCLKWACMTHLNTRITSYGKKKGWESNCQFDSQPLKVENRPDFLSCRWHATGLWIDLNEGYNFASDLILIEGLHAKLWAPKVTKVPNLGISRFPLGSPETKCHLDVGLMERQKTYYKGEGGGLLQVQAVVSLVSPNLPVAHPSTKSVPAMH